MNYAYVQGGRVFQLIEPAFDADGIEIPISARFTPEFVSACVQITGATPEVGDVVAIDGDGVASFSPYVPPAPTAAQILATNTMVRNQLLAAANLATPPLQDAVDLGEASDEEAALLKAWKQFRIAVNRIDLTQQNPNWPVPPQAGYGAAMAPSHPQTS